MKTTDGRAKRFIDRRGLRSGRLTIVSLVQRKRPAYNSVWLCDCDCGGYRKVVARQILRGHVKSCGCLGREHVLEIAGRNRLPPGEAAFRSLYGQYSRSARQRNIPFDLSQSEFRSLTAMPCAYCGAPPARNVSAGPGTLGTYRCNGVDRLNNELGYTSENARPCCTECNMAKGRMEPHLWATWLMRMALYRAPKLKDRYGNPLFVEAPVDPRMLPSNDERGDGKRKHPRERRSVSA